MKTLRKLISLACLCAFLLSLSGCGMFEDKVISSLGKYESSEFFTSGGIQDHSDYAKYYFSSAKIQNNKYLKKIQESDFVSLNTHLDDFDGWVDATKRSDESNELVLNYDFDRGIIDTEDFLYIVSEEHTWNDGHTSLVNYDIYFFDTQTQILYFFHSNI